MNNLLRVPGEAVADDCGAFWSRLLSDTSLQGCADLEKLVTGCEIIAALDDLGFLASSSQEKRRGAAVGELRKKAGRNPTVSSSRPKAIFTVATNNPVSTSATTPAATAPAARKA